MRHYLLGLELSMALAMLKSEGVEPQVTVTRAPKRQDDANCTMRVVYTSDDGKELIVPTLCCVWFMHPMTASD